MVDRAEYGIHILLAASQEYVNTYSTCRVATADAWPAALFAGAPPLVPRRSRSSSSSVAESETRRELRRAAAALALAPLTVALGEALRAAEAF